MKKIVLAGGVLALYLATVHGAIENPESRNFINDMVRKHDFSAAELDALFSRAEPRPDIIDAITRPAEGKPWYEYRTIFVNDARIDGGVEFWRTHADTLARAHSTYGVPPEIISAIIGVETRYGKNTGSYRVLDALSTLAFDYPARAKFFRGELENYLLLTRDEGIDPLSLKGSYAGAMGLPQFIPSSYRHYAVDFDNDGQRDLWTNPVDAIGSVANYFSEHGWQSDAVVALPARVSGDNYAALADEGLKPERSLREFERQGIGVAGDAPADQPAALLEFEGEAGMEYWLGFQNFYVITRYNRSPLYAMAVYQLAQAIKESYKLQVTSDKRK